jgi:hypothetical protein
MGPGYAQVVGAGYSVQVANFKEVYANLLTGDNDRAVLYDSSGPGTDQFWGNLHDAVLSDGTLDLNTGNLALAPPDQTYYFRVYGFDNAGLDPTKDSVTLYGSTTGGPNKKHIIDPLDYVLAVNGPWIDN